MIVREGGQRDRAAIARFLDDHHSARAARLSELVDPMDHPALVAEDEGRLVGVLTYIPGHPDCEVLTLHAAERHRGVGTALIDEVGRIAAGLGCCGLRLITTNDNVEALRFYQRRGFRLAALHPGAVDDSRARLKPEIPAVGEFGIPIRDELELVKPL